MSYTRHMAGAASLAVRFIRPWDVYMPGDVASFPADAARQMVGRRVAERVNIAPGPAPDGGEYALRYPAAQVNKGA
jgi:hypothetical protein